MSESLFKDETLEEKDEKKKKADKVSRKYYHLSEHDMQALIQRVKAGEDEAAEEILKVFHNFLQKYVSLLMNKNCDLRDYDIRNFIALYATKGYAKRIQYNDIDDKVYEEVQNVLKGLQYMVKRYASEEDVRHTANMVFFYCVDKYERIGSIPFSGFLYNYFLYNFKRAVDKFLISQVGRKTYYLITDDETGSSYEPEAKWASNSIETLTMEAIEESDNKHLLSMFDDIDEQWVSGESAEYPFTELTVQERQLVKWRYVDNLKGTQIANKTGSVASTIRKQLHDIEDKLKEILQY